MRWRGWGEEDPSPLIHQQHGWVDGCVILFSTGKGVIVGNFIFIIACFLHDI